MLLGFISLLLTVGQGPISEICISEEIASTWHPCSHKQEVKKYPSEKIYGENRRRLLTDVDGGFRRILAAGALDKCSAKVYFITIKTKLIMNI